MAKKKKVDPRAAKAAAAAKKKAAAAEKKKAAEAAKVAKTKAAKAGNKKKDRSKFASDPGTFVVDEHSSSTNVHRRQTFIILVDERT